MNRGEQAYSKNEREQPFGYDVDLDSAIDFLQSERASAYTGLGLDLGAAEGGLHDFLGWTAASVADESWQLAQFVGKASVYGLSLGSTSNPFDDSSYHSLIGEDAFFGTPQTFAGAVGREQGVVTSYVVGGEGLVLAGMKGVKVVGAARRGNSGPNTTRSSDSDLFDASGESDFYHTNPHGEVSRPNLDVAEPSPDIIRVTAREGGDAVDVAPNSGGTRFGPHEIGPLGNSNDPLSDASTFRSGSYTENVAQNDMYFHRDYGGVAEVDGRFWTLEPSNGPLQAQLDSAVLPEWGNTFQERAMIRIPAGTRYYEGFAAPQTGTKGTRPVLHGGGTQIFLPNPKLEWIDRP